MSTTETKQIQITRSRPWVKMTLISLGSLILFSMGAITGGYTAIHYVAKNYQSSRNNPDDHLQKVMPELRENLSLSDQQATQVEQIMRKRFAAISVLRKEYSPKVHAEFDAMANDVSNVLTDEQRPDWDKYCIFIRNHCLPVRK